MEAGETRRRTVVVDDIGHDTVERINVPDLVASPDVLVDDLSNDILDIASLRLGIVVFQRPGKPAIPQILVKLDSRVTDLLAHEPLHVKKLGKG